MSKNYIVTHQPHKISRRKLQMNKKKFAVWLISVILLSISAILLIFSLFCKNFIGNGSEVPKNPVKSRVSEFRVAFRVAFYTKNIFFIKFT